MATDLQFRWAEPDDLPALEAFLARTYGADAVQCVPGRCRWLYFDNPLGLHVTLCEDGGEIVGACGHLPQPVRVAERTVIAGFGIDFMVATSHRRRGIGRRFLDMRLERFDLSLSTGQSAGMRALYDAGNAVDLGSLFTGVFRRRPPRGGSPRTWVRNGVLWLVGLTKMRRTPTLRLRALGTTAAADLQDQARMAWYGWRFGGPIYGNHDFAVLDGASGQASAAMRTADGVRHVLDLHGHAITIAPLLVALGRAPGADETRVLGIGRMLRANLRQAGFVTRPVAANLVAMTRDHELGALLVPGVVEFTGGAADADLLRHPG